MFGLKTLCQNAVRTTSSCLLPAAGRKGGAVGGITKAATVGAVIHNQRFFSSSGGGQQEKKKEEEEGTFTFRDLAGGKIGEGEGPSVFDERAEIERQVILGDHIKNQIHINLEDYIENYDPNGPYYEEPALQALMKPFHPTDDLDRYEIITLKRDTFGQPLRRDILHRVVTWQRAGWRAGTANTKTKGEVSGTGKKPFPQKGRGAARHGSLRNPQFVGGGRAHGPKPRDWSYSLPKKVRRLGIKVALSAKYAQGDLHIVDDVDMDSHKTRDMKEILTRHGWIDRETLLIGRDDMSENVRLSSYNITNLITLPVSGLNVYNILHCRNLVISSQVLSDIYMRVEGRNSQHFYNYEEMVLGKDPFENIYLGGELMTFEDGPEMEYATIEEEGIPTDTKTPPTSSGV